MKKALVAVLGVIMLALVPIIIVGTTQHTAAADPVVACHVKNNTVTCSVGGVIVLQLPLPKVTVSVPGPRRTITVHVPGPTRTVHVPGPVRTHTVTVTCTQIETVPGPTTTKTVRVRGPVTTKTASPAPQPTTTITAAPQVTKPRSRQPSPAPVTLVPPARHTIINVPAINLSTPAAVGVGLLTLLILAGLIILGLWSGYYLGYKDSDNAERKFLKALLRK